MRSRLLALVWIGLAGSCRTPDAADASARGTGPLAVAPYFAMNPGDRFVYRISRMDETRDVALTVERSAEDERIPGTVQPPLGGALLRKESALRFVDDQGRCHFQIHRLGSYDLVFGPNLDYLHATVAIDAAPGMSWTGWIYACSGWFFAEITYAGRSEPVDVPAGSYEALAIKGLWLVRGIGIARWVDGLGRMELIRIERAPKPRSS